MLHLKDLFKKVKAHFKKYSYIYALLLIFVLVFVSCQGLVNANGDNNSIVVHKEGGII